MPVSGSIIVESCFVVTDLLIHTIFLLNNELQQKEPSNDFYVFKILIERCKQASFTRTFKPTVDLGWVYNFELHLFLA